jgi:hypothetical protein
VKTASKNVSGNHKYSIEFLLHLWVVYIDTVYPVADCSCLLLKDFMGEGLMLGKPSKVGKAIRFTKNYFDDHFASQLSDPTKIVPPGILFSTFVQLVLTDSFDTDSFTVLQEHCSASPWYNSLIDMQKSCKVRDGFDFGIFSRSKKNAKEKKNEHIARMESNHLIDQIDMINGGSAKADARRRQEVMTYMLAHNLIQKITYNKKELKKIYVDARLQQLEKDENASADALMFPNDQEGCLSFPDIAQQMPTSFAEFNKAKATKSTKTKTTKKSGKKSIGDKGKAPSLTQSQSYDSADSRAPSDSSVGYNGTPSNKSSQPFTDETLAFNSPSTMVNADILAESTRASQQLQSRTKKRNLTPDSSGAGVDIELLRMAGSQKKQRLSQESTGKRDDTSSPTSNTKQSGLAVPPLTELPKSLGLSISRDEMTTAQKGQQTKWINSLYQWQDENVNAGHTKETTVNFLLASRETTASLRYVKPVVLSKLAITMDQLNEAEAEQSKVEAMNTDDEQSKPKGSDDESTENEDE